MAVASLIVRNPSVRWHCFFSNLSLTCDEECGGVANQLMAGAEYVGMTDRYPALSTTAQRTFLRRSHTVLLLPPDGVTRNRHHILVSE